MQLFGNLLKIFLYPHFRLFPYVRFTLPTHAHPLLHRSSARGITRIVWQTNYTDRVTLPVYLNYLWNRLMSPTHEYRFCDDDACEAFIRQEYSGEIHQAWSRLQIGAAKADFWRVLALLKHGGLYMDVDAALCWSAEGLAKPDQTELFIRNPDGTLTNFFMASAPGNPLLQAMIEQILDNIRTNTLASVYDMTGPTVVDAIANRDGVTIERARLVCRQGQFTSKVFQYPDNLRGYWVKEQQENSILK
jgi:mannosyltransferase OCH1-like enzyme